MSYFVDQPSTNTLSISLWPPFYLPAPSHHHIPSRYGYFAKEDVTKVQLQKDYMGWLDLIEPMPKLPQPKVFKPRPAPVSVTILRIECRQQKQVHQHQAARRAHRRESPRPRTKLRAGNR